MSVGLEALIIFKAKGTVGTRKKYPIIYRNNIDKKCAYNPNNDYLYVLSTEDSKRSENQISPLYYLTLIPETTTEGKSSLDASVYLMQFLNWAIYYYRYLKSFYAAIPKDPNLELRTEAKIRIDTINTMMDRHYISGQENQGEKSILKRNNVPLKPALFLKLCRFFARAWYEENFCSRDNAIGSVKFAHYATNYITGDPDTICKYYDGNNIEAQKEVTKLFINNSASIYKFNNFAIEIQRFDNSPEDPQESHSYAISITQLNCKHEFYMYARLRQYRYISSIVQRLHLNPYLHSIEMEIIPQDESVKPFRISVGRYELKEKDDGKHALIIYGINMSHPFADTVTSVQIEKKESNVPAEYANTFERFARTYSLSETLNTLETRTKK